MLARFPGGLLGHRTINIAGAWINILLIQIRHFTNPIVPIVAQSSIATSGPAATSTSTQATSSIATSSTGSSSVGSCLASTTPGACASTSSTPGTRSYATQTTTTFAMPSNAKLAETVKNLRAEKEDLTTRNAVLESRVTALKKQVPGDATVKAAFITRLKEDRAKYYELSDTRGSALACIGIMIPISFLQSGARALGDDIYAGDLSYEEKIALAKAEPNRMQVSAQSYMEALRRSKIKMLDCMSSMHTLLSEGEQSEEVQEVMKAIGVLLKETNGNISRKEEKAAKRTRAQLFQVMAKPSDEAEKKVEKGLVKRTSPEEMGLRASERAAEKFSMDGGLKVADGVKY